MNGGPREGGVPAYVERGLAAAPDSGEEPEGGEVEAEQSAAPTPEPPEPEAGAEAEEAEAGADAGAAAGAEAAADAEAAAEAAADAGATAKADTEADTEAAAGTAAAAAGVMDGVSAEVTRPPLLASEALMEDLAPMEPARGGARLWCAGLGAAFLLLGMLSIAGVRPGGVWSGANSFMLGVVALMCALTRITYRQRAAAMVALGVMATALGLAGSGPAIGISAGGAGWGAARAIAAAALPAALLFRSRYRAYAGARWLLGAAFGAALPFLGYVVFRLITHEMGLADAGAVFAVIAMTAGLFGFMGSETTSAGSWLALGVIAALAADLACLGLAGLPELTVVGAVSVVSAALALGATSALTSIGIFQILAWRLAPDARRIDLHPDPKNEPARPRSGSDWLT